MSFCLRVSKSFLFPVLLLTSALAMQAQAPVPKPAAQPLLSLHQGFLNPAADARPMMRWWWFGPAVIKPELAKELETMRGAGIGGVEIQPVYPLMLDDPAKGIKNLSYLSPEFLDDIGFANRTARALGMRVDITLGSGWPYGGPKTTTSLAAGRLKVIAVPLTSTLVSPPNLAPGDITITTFIVSGTEKSFDPATAIKLDPSGSVPTLGPGEHTLLFFVASHTGQTVKRPSLGAEGKVLDHFSRAAIDEHLTDVAAPLLKAFGTQPPYSCFSDSLEVYGADWTPQLPEEFQKRRGYDLIPHLPALLAGGTPEAAAIRHDWGLTLSDLVRDNYLVPVTQFATAHHSLFRSQTYGVPAVTLADEAIPNLPEGEGPQWRAFSFSRWATSASHLYNRNITSAETFTWLHSPSFRATPLDMKAEADRMFLIGINQIIGHGWPYSPQAVGEPGWALYAAAVFNAHNPWFPVMPDVTKYIQRMSWLLRQGKPANDVAILLPEDDAQASFAPGSVSITDEMRLLISPELMATILDAGYNIDYIDAATVDKLGTIPYPILIIPPTERIPLVTYKKIQEYASGSGKVIAIEKLPSLAPGFLEQKQSPDVAAISQHLFRDAGHTGVFVDFVSQLPNALHKALSPDLNMTGQFAGLGFIHRKFADSDVYFVANTSNEPVNASVQFRAHHTSLEAWNPDSGKVLWSAKHQLSDQVQVALAPYESRVFVLSNHAASSQSPVASAMDKQLADLSSGWQIHFPGSRATQPLGALTSWTEIKDRQYFSGEVDYTRTFTLDEAVQPNTHLLIDFGTGTPTAPDRRPPTAPGMRALLDQPIREAAIIYVNGQRVGSLWHPPYRIDVSAFAHRGENRLEVRVYNTAINMLAGQPPRDYSALYAKYGKRFEPQDMDNLKPIPSGLFGPIQLLQETAQ